MAKKKKGVLNQILGIAENVTGGITRFIPEPEQIYNITKDVVATSSKNMAINDRKNKIREMLIDIGDRVYEKNIEVDDRNVKAEVECIKELLSKRID